MKVRGIPAQITTVEDKIAGNLSLTQLLLLMLPVFWFMLVYTLFLPAMHFTWYKVPLIFFVSITSLTLSLRIKEKIILQWLLILLRYNLRPRYYLFDKNDSYLRTMHLIHPEKNKRRVIAKSGVKEKQVFQATLTFDDLVRFEGLLADPKFSFSIKSQKKGALYVAVEQNQ